MFCRNCGAQLTAAFCTRCGAPAVQPPPPVQSAAPQPSSQQPPPAAKTGSGLKVLFVVLGVMVFLGVLLAGTIWYGWHKVKQTVASQGIDLSTVVDRGAGRQFDACELLTKEDLAQILNLAIERSEGTGRSTHSTCRYYSSAAQQRGADEAAAAFKKLQQNTNGASPQPNKHVLGRTKHEQNLTHLHQLFPLKMSKSNDSPAQQD
ncbi:MAG: zinc ribbon domain-containing protein, partial [Candidatus Acidiferrales bacterium]